MINIIAPLWEFIMTNAIYIQNCVSSIIDYYFKEDEYEAI